MQDISQRITARAHEMLIKINDMNHVPFKYIIEKAIEAYYQKIKEERNGN